VSFIVFAAFERAPGQEDGAAAVFLQLTMPHG